MDPEDFGSEASRYTAIFIASVLAMVSFSGLATIVFMSLFARFRAGPALEAAPSGAPATFFPRSPFMTVMSVVFLVFLVGWSGALAIVLYGHGHGGWASLVVALALVFLWPVAVLLTGQIKSGGLWLTPDGLEYRKEAVSWTLAWSDLDGVDRTRSAVQKGVLPHASGLGVVAVVGPADALAAAEMATRADLRGRAPSTRSSSANPWARAWRSRSALAT